MQSWTPVWKTARLCLKKTNRRDRRTDANRNSPEGKRYRNVYWRQGLLMEATPSYLVGRWFMGRQDICLISYIFSNIIFCTRVCVQYFCICMYISDCMWAHMCGQPCVCICEASGWHQVSFSSSVPRQVFCWSPASWNSSAKQVYPASCSGEPVSITLELRSATISAWLLHKSWGSTSWPHALPTEPSFHSDPVP